MVLLQPMLVLFIYMLLGFALGKAHILDEAFSKKLSWLVIYVANVAMIISSVVNGEGTIQGEELLLTTGIAVIMFAALIVIGQLVPHLFRVPASERAGYTMLTTFNNTGFMGLPLVTAVYGAGAALYVSIFILIFNVLVYTYGIAVLKESRGHFTLSAIVNAGVLSCVAAIILYLGDIQTPAFFNSAVSGLGALTAPLSMIVIGISLSQMALHKLVTDIRLLLFSLFKLLVIPILGMLIINQFVESEVLRGVCMVMLATPSASMVAMLAKQYDKSAELASRGVALTTLLSVVTIPIVSTIVL